MSTLIPQGSERLEISDLTRPFVRGCKPKAQWKLGAEYEKFVVEGRSNMPVTYGEPNGIRGLLEHFAEHHGWQRYEEHGFLVALQRGGESISLEPGGQVELSGAPLASLHEVAEELARHNAELAGYLNAHDLRALWVGVHPTATLESVEWMPKPRYDIMRAYLPSRGSLSSSMMKLTCTVQANIDYESEADAYAKFRLGMALTPFVTAIFANSWQLAGHDSGYKSWRQHIWTAVDPDRSGQLALAYEEPASFFEAYAEWALDVPMFFIHRDGRYVDVAGLPFRQFLERGVGDWHATHSDWALHLSTLFPDVRLKNYLEVRAADSVPPPFAMAVPALWKGLLYDQQSMDAAWELLAGQTFGERVTMRDEAARLGLHAEVGGMSLRAMAPQLLKLAVEGLDRQVGLTAAPGERAYLEPLQALIEGGFACVGDILRSEPLASGSPRS